MEATGRDVPGPTGKRRRYDGARSLLKVLSPTSSRSRSSLSQKRAKRDIAPKWIADVLQSNKLIVSNIFDYLTAHELTVAARVCSLWGECAEKAVKKRLHIHQFSKMEAEGDVCAERKALGRHCLQNLRECYAFPRLVMIFSTRNFLDDGQKYFDEFTSSKEDFSANIKKLRASEKNVYNLALTNHISTLMPPGSLIQQCSAWGIVTTEVGKGPIEYEVADGFVAMTFPEYPNVKMHAFSIKEPKSITHHPDGYHILNAADLGHVKDAKAVIAFSRGIPEEPSFASFLVEALFEAYPNLALAGATVQRHSVLESSESELKDKELVDRYRKAADHEIGLCGIVIEGDVRAASVVLSQDCRGSAAVRERMSTLKSFPIVAGRTVGFMFSCCGRGRYHHGSVNVEGEAFGNIFPGVPLIGVFGNGEFGIDSFADNSKNAGFEFRHSYTTVLMLLTFNPPPSEETERRI